MSPIFLYPFAKLKSVVQLAHYYGCPVMRSEKGPEKGGSRRDLRASGIYVLPSQYRGLKNSSKKWLSRFTSSTLIVYSTTSFRFTPTARPGFRTRQHTRIAAATINRSSRTETRAQQPKMAFLDQIIVCIDRAGSTFISSGDFRMPVIVRQIFKDYDGQSAS